MMAIALNKGNDFTTWLIGYGPYEKVIKDFGFDLKEN
jgi:hypothetical protein